ncbi:MAG TPA: outer membrane beta-barrel protein [Gemmatimonadaceae bacterium]
MTARPRHLTLRTLLSISGCILAADITCPKNVQAQLPGSTSYSFTAAAGLAVPTGDLSNTVNSGYNVSVALGMHQALTPFSLRVEGSFTEMPWSDNTGESGAKHRIFGLALDGLFNVGTPSTNGGLYLTGGVGTYGTNDVNTFFGDTNRDWNFGFNAGLGYYLPLTGFSVIFEGRYTYIGSNPSQSFFPITVGVTF